MIGGILSLFFRYVNPEYTLLFKKELENYLIIFESFAFYAIFWNYPFVNSRWFVSRNVYALQLEEKENKNDTR